MQIKKNFISSSRLKNKKNKKKRLRLKLKLILFCIFILFFLGGSYFILNRDDLKINKIEILGNNILENNILEDYIQNKINQNFFYVYPKDNFILFNKRKIEKEIKTDFTRIENISFNLSDINLLKINIKERDPVFLYCGLSLEELERENCQFMDKDGFIFDSAPYFSGNIYFKFYGPTYDFRFGENYFNNFVLLKNNLEILGLEPTHLIMIDDKKSEIYLNTDKERYTEPKIIFNNNSSFDKISEDLAKALNTEPLKTNFENKYTSLEYIDLRFNNRVYYKFK